MTIKGRFTVTIYDAHVHIVVSDNMKRVINIRLGKDNEGRLDCEPRGFSYHDTETTDYYLYLHPNDINHDTINHEKSHIVDFILEHIGIPSNDEPRAFLDAYISEKVYSFLKKHKFKIK